MRDRLRPSCLAAALRRPAQRGAAVTRPALLPPMAPLHLDRRHPVERRRSQRGRACHRHDGRPLDLLSQPAAHQAGVCACVRHTTHLVPVLLTLPILYPSYSTYPSYPISQVWTYSLRENLCAAGPSGHMRARRYIERPHDDGEGTAAGAAVGPRRAVAPWPSYVHSYFQCERPRAGEPVLWAGARSTAVHAPPPPLSDLLRPTMPLSTPL